MSGTAGNESEDRPNAVSGAVIPRLAALSLRVFTFADTSLREAKLWGDAKFHEGFESGSRLGSAHSHRLRLEQPSPDGLVTEPQRLPGRRQAMSPAAAWFFLISLGFACAGGGIPRAAGFLAGGLGRGCRGSLAGQRNSSCDGEHHNEVLHRDSPHIAPAVHAGLGRTPLESRSSTHEQLRRPCHFHALNVGVLRTPKQTTPHMHSCATSPKRLRSGDPVSVVVSSSLEG